TLTLGDSGADFGGADSSRASSPFFALAYSSYTWRDTNAASEPCDRFTNTSTASSSDSGVTSVTECASAAKLTNHPCHRNRLLDVVSPFFQKKKLVCFDTPLFSAFPYSPPPRMPLINALGCFSWI